MWRPQPQQTTKGRIGVSVDNQYEDPKWVFTICLKTPSECWQSDWRPQVSADDRSDDPKCVLTISLKTPSACWQSVGRPQHQTNNPREEEKMKIEKIKKEEQVRPTRKYWHCSYNSRQYNTIEHGVIETVPLWNWEGHEGPADCGTKKIYGEMAHKGADDNQGNICVTRAGTRRKGNAPMQRMLYVVPKIKYPA